MITFCLILVFTNLNIINARPHCDKVDSFGPIPLNSNGSWWWCFNYRTFPTNLYNASTVEKLWMSGSDSDFPTLEKLKDLELYNLPNLVDLRLSFFKFHEVERGAFKNAGKLVNLELNWNCLMKLDAQVFTDIPTLQTLQITGKSWTPLQDFESLEFPKLENLTELVTESLGIPFLKRNFFKNLESMQTLDLNQNKLTILDDREVFRSLKNLKVLKLSFNRIRYVDPEVFADLRNLELLDLSQNKLRKGFKKDARFHNPNLKRLYLEHCRLKHIEENLFEKLVNLKELSLRRNRLSHISPKMFSSFKSLESLWLDQNPIKTLEPNLFSDLPKLEYLDIGTRTLKNYLMDDSSELNNQNLQKLKITATGLTSISANLLKNLGNLTYLNLRFNKFKSLDWKVLQPLKNLSTILLDGNPWQCDCQVVFLQEFLKQKEISFPYDIPTCKTFGEKGELVRKHFPEGYLEWKDIQQEKLNCSTFPW